MRLSPRRVPPTKLCSCSRCRRPRAIRRILPPRRAAVAPRLILIAKCSAPVASVKIKNTSSASAAGERRTSTSRRTLMPRILLQLRRPRLLRLRPQRRGHERYRRRFQRSTPQKSRLEIQMGFDCRYPPRGDPVSGLRPALLHDFGVPGNALVGDRVFFTDAEIAALVRPLRHVYWPGAGFALEPAVGDVWDRQDAGGILRRIGGTALRSQ